jgi:murein L,D-transpeptidase YafK
LSRSPRLRLLLASAAIAASIGLAGCQTEGTDLSARALTPLSPKMLAAFEQKNMDKGSPILVRLFKQEAELEVWKQDRSGQYALLKTYPVCRWSGELGPKLREGDRQAPEGFYSITRGQMNPASQYYLAFNIGYPNAYDRAWGRTGAELMIHGDCSSRGCYAMTDEQISEIYALGREAFFGGQRAFQVQAYPFRMTPENFAKHRNNPNMAFWKMLKRGNDHFEVTHQEPKVSVCEKHYVFDAQAPGNSSAPLTFNPAGKCPQYEVPADVAAAVAEKQRQDEYQTAELITRGTKTSPVRTGADGGMHPIFLAALQRQDPSVGGTPVTSLSMFNPAPGTIPRNAVPPKTPQEVAADAQLVTASTSTTAPAPTPSVLRQTVTATPTQAPALPQAPAPAARAASPLQPAPGTVPATLAKVAPPSNARASATHVDANAAVSAAKQPQTLKPLAVKQTPQAPATPVAGPRSKPATLAASPAPASGTAKPASDPRSADAASLLQKDAPMPSSGSFESRWSAISGRGRF